MTAPDPSDIDGPAGEAGDLIEPVAWRWYCRASEDFEYLDNERGDFDAYKAAHPTTTFRPLYDASALAAYQAKVDEIEEELAQTARFQAITDADREYGYTETPLVSRAEAAAELSRLEASCDEWSINAQRMADAAGSWMARAQAAETKLAEAAAELSRLRFWHEHYRNSAEMLRADLTAATEDNKRLMNGLVAAKPIIERLIASEHNIETWGLKQRLAAIDAALEGSTR